MNRASWIAAPLIASCAGPASPASAKPAPKPPSAEAPRAARASWDPRKTRVFIACLARFAGEADGKTSFSTDDRLDTAFVELLVARGVPKQNIVFLMDEQATKPAVEKALRSHLSASAADETLLFYFGSHGNYNAKTGAHSFSTFESSVPMEWVLDEIEAHFRGAQALLFADSCYSGGLATRAARRSGSVAYSVLGSTGPQQVAWSKWRFVDSLIKGFSGDPLLDLNGDGAVNLAELSAYTGARMAFAAEGKPTSFLAAPALEIARVTKPREVPRGGRYLEVSSKGKWYKAEVLEQRGKELFIHYTSYDSSWDEWVGPERVREFEFARFPIGDEVEAAGSSSGKWYKATVLDTYESLHLVRWEGYSSAYDEWVGPSRIRAAR